MYVENNMEKDSIQAMMILEILGKPKEYILESLKTLVEKLSTEKGVKINNHQIHDPINVKESTQLFTTFAEIDIQFDSLDNYISIMFGYMPSNIQIISPEKLSLSNSYLNEVGNKIIQRLHNYDAITKKVLNEHQLIMEKIKQSSPEIYNKIIPQNNKKQHVIPANSKVDANIKKPKNK